MTPVEIYLDFRSAPDGSLGVTSSLYEAGAYMGTRLVGTARLGCTIGPAVNNLIETYDPDLEEAIGATVSGMLDQITAAESAAADGNFEEAFDRLFSIPIAFNNPGDFDVTLEMADLQGSEC